MRLSLRFIIPLLLALAGIAYAVVPVVDRLTLRWFMRDLEIRATLVASTVQEPLERLVGAGDKKSLLQFFTRISQEERIFAVGFCASPTSTPVTASASRIASRIILWPILQNSHWLPTGVEINCLKLIAVKNSYENEQFSHIPY